ncbi:MAG TPA: inositol monophosphatase family protein [Candidatus Saccharibacteria bacterium]|jgi:fructose-1,6-bisphosphatase/inositol monophosphatase family enzyme|nr:inositol monophosphatase family protein [Candidatus Saccharibacteria bacterium]HMT56304.1 inositol monophosphatase family protein [Candidatus Saccharibacteria bacterium]
MSNNDNIYTDTPQVLRAFETIFKQLRPEIMQFATTKYHVEEKADGSPVTELDVRIEKSIHAYILDKFPDIQVYGEESGYDEKALKGSYWLVDPIDGTQSFVDNIPTFTSMAVLIEGDEAFASVIYNHSTDELYTAIRGKGAYKNGVRLDLNNTELPKKILAKDAYIDRLHQLFPDYTFVVAPTGAGYGFSQVAEGKVAARFQLQSKGYLHDYATGALLVSEAGGQLISTDESPFNVHSRSFVACHPAFVDTVQSCRAGLLSIEQS